MKSLTLTLSPRTGERGAKGSAGASPSKMRLRTGKAFWASKLAANVARDKFVTRTLRHQGWTVLRIWEHEIAKNPERCVARIRGALGE